MRANEYFKKHGYKHCKSACVQNGWLSTGFWVHLKRLVESHEFVSANGGVEGAMKYINSHDPNATSRHYNALRAKVADVESYQ